MKSNLPFYAEGLFALSAERSGADTRKRKMAATAMLNFAVGVK